MAATNAAGTTTIRYGKMRANVLALEAVLADGTVIRTGSRARKTSAGYDLTSLLVGSEGTLGVITEVRVRLYGIPEHVVAQRISFPTIEAACRTAAAVVAAGSAVTRLELLDASTLAAINAYRGSSYPEGPCLLVEAAGTEATVEADLELVRELAEAEGATEIVDERDADRPGQALGRAARRRLRDGRSLAGTARARDRHVRSGLRAGRRRRVRPRRGGAPRLQGVHPRPRRRRQPPRQPAARLRRPGRAGARRRARRAARRRRARTRRHLHGRARHRPGQDRRARARAWRPRAADAGDQARLRPARDHESRQDLQRLRPGTTEHAASRAAVHGRRRGGLVDRRRVPARAVRRHGDTARRARILRVHRARPLRRGQEPPPDGRRVHDDGARRPRRGRLHRARVGPVHRRAESRERRERPLHAGGVADRRRAARVDRARRGDLAHGRRSQWRLRYSESA